MDEKVAEAAFESAVQGYEPRELPYTLLCDLKLVLPAGVAPT